MDVVLPGFRYSAFYVVGFTDAYTAAPRYASGEALVGLFEGCHQRGRVRCRFIRMTSLVEVAWQACGHR